MIYIEKKEDCKKKKTLCEKQRCHKYRGHLDLYFTNFDNDCGKALLHSYVFVFDTGICNTEVYSILVTSF
jgi:hypothetical protein